MATGGMGVCRVGMGVSADTSAGANTPHNPGADDQAGGVLPGHPPLIPSAARPGDSLIFHLTH